MKDTNLVQRRRLVRQLGPIAAGRAAESVTQWLLPRNPDASATAQLAPTYGDAWPTKPSRHAYAAHHSATPTGQEMHKPLS
jgi:hypothetical protein